jgi:pimeloyl-ACP methyl ester carboxylesterase
MASRAILSLGVALLALLVPASASALNVTGTWNANYYCEVGWCAGNNFPAPGVVLEQEKGSSHVNAPPSASGTLSGNVLTLDGEEGSYKFHEVLTIAPDGKSWEGPLSDSHGTSGTDTGVKVSGPEEGTVVGAVEDENDLPLAGVTVKLEGVSDTEEKKVNLTATSSANGNYSFEVEPGTYTVTASGEPTEHNGGTLAVRKSPTEPHAPECNGSVKEASCAMKHIAGSETSHVNFTYFECSATGRKVNGKEPTGCPIIFIPGFLGSRISCSTGEMWTNLPNPDFADLQLKSDGVTNSGAPGSCAATAEPLSGQEGVVSRAVVDIYGGVLEYLNRIAPKHVYALPYDWRKSPLIAKEALGKLIDEVLKSTGATRVVLMGHSMGGLVLQSYIAESSNANKVTRAVTLGTPYWGAVKSHVALLTGKSNEVAQETFGLDMFVKRLVAEEEESSGIYNSTIFANDLQLAARNMQGLYWLYPADEYGPWLQVTSPGYPFGFMKSSQIRPWVTSLGGTPALITNAVSGHTAITGYPSNGVDFQVVAGAGTPTEAAMKVEENPAAITQPVTVWYASGDGTVPLVSATEGASEGKPVPILIHYICKVGHVALPGNATVQTGIEAFLLKGEAITGLEDNCPYTGIAMKVFEPVVVEHGKAAIGSSVKTKASTKGTLITVTTTSGTISLEEAVERGLVTTLQAGGTRFIATSNQVTVNVSGASVAVSVQSIKSGGKGHESGSGPAALYGPVSGSLAVGPTGVVSHSSKRLRARHAAKAPHTTARVSKHGHGFIVRLSAHAAAGVAATYVRIGKGHPARYRRALVLTAKQLKALRFESVDRFGRWERPQRAHR